MKSMTQTTKLPPALATIHVATEEMRWRILHALSSGPMTARALADKLQTSSPHTLWHCRKLEEMGLVRVRLVEPEAGGMRVKQFCLVPMQLTIRLDAGNASVTAKKL